MSILSILTPVRSAWALAGMLVVCLGLYLWGDAKSARLDLANEKLSEASAALARARVVITLANTQMKVVATVLTAGKARTAATDLQKKKVLNEEDAAVPGAVRAALDGVRDLRAGNGNR